MHTIVGQVISKALPSGSSSWCFILLSIGNGSGLNTSAVTRGKCGPGQRLVLDADAVGEQRCIGERKYRREQRQSERKRNHRDLKNDNHIVRMPQPADPTAGCGIRTMWLSFLRSRWFRLRSDCRCSRLYFRSPIQRCSPTASASRTRRWPGPHLPRVTAEVLRPEPLPMDSSMKHQDDEPLGNAFDITWLTIVCIKLKEIKAGKKIRVRTKG